MIEGVGVSRREYPQRPIVGVGAVVCKDGKVLLVQRAAPPSRGLWAIPGGSLEVGEYVLAKFFNNDIHLAGSRNRYKPVSYRKLCDHPDLSVSRFTLMKMVKTAAQQGFLVAAVKNYLVRINRWIRKLDVPEGMTNQSVITGADAADRGKAEVCESSTTSTTKACRCTC